MTEILNTLFMRAVMTMTNYDVNVIADDLQKQLYKKFPTTHFLSNKNNLDHFYRWNTFFRRNLNRFATDFLNIP